MQNWSLIIWTAVIAGLFLFLWRKGYLLRLRTYTLETREELRKCTWPGRQELKGSTTVVMVTIFLLGLFTYLVDQVIFVVVVWMTAP
jgi:preprotein translocase SecE subunit